MKKLILFILLALPGIGFAQITEVKDNSIKVGELPTMESRKVDSLFIITYQDYQYQSIKEYASLGISLNDAEALYNKLKKAFELPKGETMTLQLPENLLTISSMKFFGTKGIMISNKNKNRGNSIIPPISLKQLDTLFGKS